MPIRVKSKAQHADALRTPSPTGMAHHSRWGAELPDISSDDSFRVLVKKLSVYIADVIQLPVTFEQLRTTSAGDGLRTLVDHLGRNCTHPAIVNALLYVNRACLTSFKLLDAMLTIHQCAQVALWRHQRG